MLRRNCILASLLIPTLIAILAAQSKPDAPEYDVKEHYTKYEYRIAMRDVGLCSQGQLSRLSISD
jgi:hypothetical protein